MSYRVDLVLPSCCAEKLDLAAEVEKCTPQEMLVRLFMVGLSAWSAMKMSASEDGLQATCDQTNVLLLPLMREMWGV